MRVKSNKALRRSARLARRAPSSPVVVLPAATSFPRRPWLRVGAANSVAAAVAGILYGSGGAAYAQEQAGGAPPGGAEPPGRVGSSPSPGGEETYGRLNNRLGGAATI